MVFIVGTNTRLRDPKKKTDKSSILTFLKSENQKIQSSFLCNLPKGFLLFFTIFYFFILEILIHIFSFLPSISAISCVCQQFNQISMEPSLSHLNSYLVKSPFVTTKEAQDYAKILHYKYIELKDELVVPNMSELFDKFVRNDEEREMENRNFNNKNKSKKKKKWFNIF